MWVNAESQRFWVKYHFKTERDIQNFTDAESRAMRSVHLDCHRRDLFEAIIREEYPSWRLEMQIMPYEDAVNLPVPTPSTLPKSGRIGPPGHSCRSNGARSEPIELLREVTEVAFDVATFVPSIGPRPDRMVMGRMFVYGDSNRYRTGTNWQQLPVNCPIKEVRNYNKDGLMRFTTVAASRCMHLTVMARELMRSASLTNPVCRLRRDHAHCLCSA